MLNWQKNGNPLMLFYQQSNMSREMLQEEYAVTGLDGSKSASGETSRYFSVAQDKSINVDGKNVKEGTGLTRTPEVH